MLGVWVQRTELSGTANQTGLYDKGEDVHCADGHTKMSWQENTVDISRKGSVLQALLEDGGKTTMVEKEIRMPRNKFSTGDAAIYPVCKNKETSLMSGACIVTSNVTGTTDHK